MLSGAAVTTQLGRIATQSAQLCEFVQERTVQPLVREHCSFTGMGVCIECHQALDLPSMLWEEVLQLVSSAAAHELIPLKVCHRIGVGRMSSSACAQLVLKLAQRCTIHDELHAWFADTRDGTRCMLSSVCCWILQNKAIHSLCSDSTWCGS